MDALSCERYVCKLFWRAPIESAVLVELQTPLYFHCLCVAIRIACICTKSRTYLSWSAVSDNIHLCILNCTLRWLLEWQCKFLCACTSRQAHMTFVPRIGCSCDAFVSKQGNTWWQLLVCLSTHLQAIRHGLLLRCCVSFYRHASINWAICGLEHDMQPDVCVLLHEGLELHDQLQYTCNARRLISKPHLGHSAQWKLISSRLGRTRIIERAWTLRKWLHQHWCVSDYRRIYITTHAVCQPKPCVSDNCTLISHVLHNPWGQSIHTALCSD